LTYFGFLLRFLAMPVIVFSGITLWDARRGKSIPGFRGGRAVWIAMGLHVLLAVLYTTPWDNYLVASGVWGYSLRLVTGLTLGWVPVEEYLFFILETVLTGLWWRFLATRLSAPAEFKPSKIVRSAGLSLLGVIWLISIFILISGWSQGRYLGLILAWALPAIAPQFAFGADILWHYRRLVVLTVLPVFVYLSAADALAIASGTWSINPTLSTGIFIGTLPLEEALFFFVTVTLIGFGLTLALAGESRARINRLSGFLR
jgi:lycopene beta-cyclase